MSRKLAVFFPGAGYHNDNPLKYYTKRIARNQAYEVVEISFDLSGAAAPVKGDRERIRIAVDTAFRQACGKLRDIGFDQYEKVVFVGKSIGTAVMARYSMAYGLDPEMILFTPIAETFEYPGIRGSVFHGSADPLFDAEICRKRCEEMSLACTVIPEANHSLETGDVETDISILRGVMKAVDGIISRV